LEYLTLAIKKSFFQRFGVKRKRSAKYTHPARINGKLSLIKAIKNGDNNKLPVIKIPTFFIALLFLIVIIYIAKVVILFELTKHNYLKINVLNFI
jgi:hypothetical protein